MSEEFNQVLAGLTNDSLVEDTLSRLEKLLHNQAYKPGLHDGLFLKGCDIINTYTNKIAELPEFREKVEKLKARLDIELSLIDNV